MFIVHVAGHLGKDPEVRFTPGGQKVTTFSLAVNQRKGKEETTTWVRITIWGDRLDKLVSFLKKGSGVIVSGKLSPPTTYTDKEGRLQVTLEVTAEMIEFSPFGRSDRLEGGASSANSYSSQPTNGNAGYGSYDAESSSKTTPSYGSFSSGKGAMSDIDEDMLPF